MCCTMRNISTLETRVFGALCRFGGAQNDSGTAESGVDLARSEPSRTNQSAVFMATVRASAVMKQ